jgi:putative membrane protein
MGLNDGLALADACLTAVAVACMLLGYHAIRRKRVARHRNFMLGAVAASTGFLAIFVFRFVRFGFHPFARSGVLRVVFDAVFFSHEPLAVVNVPLVLGAAALGLAGRVPTHREIARWALPIWIYVGVTGILIYFLLYG